jgi:serine/threonine protein kinase
LVRVSFRGHQGQGDPVTEAPYRLIARIASGELAETFRAVGEDSLPVAIKLFQAKTADERYARELAEVARRLLAFHAPGIVQVVDIGFVSGRLAVVRQSVDGFNLGQVLSRLTARGIIFPTPLALWVLCELLDAVRRAHAAGVVHGGITAGNIFLCPDGQPALCDFGALQALWAVRELKERFIRAGRGSYRAQEIERGEPATQQSDVFSLGAVAYQLLTLREVSPGRGDASAPQASRAVSSRIDQQLYPILMKSMEAIPQLRYSSCTDFAEALQKYLSAKQLSPGPRDLQKFVGDLFPDGVEPRSGEDQLPFTEPFSLEPIPGLAPLKTPLSPEPARSTSAADAGRNSPPSPGAAAGGFEAAWYAAPSLSKLEETVQPPPTEEMQGRRGTGRRPAAVFGGSLVIAAFLALALAVWRPGHSGAERGAAAEMAGTRLSTAQASSAPGPSSSKSSPAPLAENSQPAPLPARHTARSEPPIEWDSPPRRGGGFLSVASDVPALVYIDGRRVRQPAPLKRYPVQVGVRRISVVAADTRQRRDVTLRFNRGQVRKLDEAFQRSSAQR